MRFTFESVEAPIATMTSPSLRSGASTPQLPTRMSAWTPYSWISSVA